MPPKTAASLWPVADFDWVVVGIPHPARWHLGKRAAVCRAVDALGRFADGVTAASLRAVSQAPRLPLGAIANSVPTDGLLPAQPFAWKPGAAELGSRQRRSLVLLAALLRVRRAQTALVQVPIEGTSHLVPAQFPALVVKSASGATDEAVRFRHEVSKLWRRTAHARIEFDLER